MIRTAYRHAAAALVAAVLVSSALLMAPVPAGAAGNPYSTYEFHFVNGMILTGSTEGGRGFEAPVFDTGFTIHVSCSAVFEDGWSSTGAFPNPAENPDWEIDSYRIERHKADGSFHFACEEPWKETTTTTVPVPSTSTTTPPVTTSTTVPATSTSTTTPPVTTSTTVPATSTSTTTPPVTTSTTVPATSTSTTVPRVATSTTASPSTTVPVSTASTVHESTPTTVVAGALGSIGDRVWIDVDGFGGQDAGEPGVAGVTVRLFEATSGSVVGQMVTDADGFYRFEGVPGGEYFLEFVIDSLPVDYYITTPDAVLDDLDSDGDEITGRTAVFVLGSGATDLTRDLGVYLQQVSPVLLTAQVETSTTSGAATGVTVETLPLTGISTSGLAVPAGFMVLVGMALLLVAGRMRPQNSACGEPEPSRIWEA